MSSNNPYAGMTFEELMKNPPPWKRKARPEQPNPTLTLAASRDRDPDEQSKVASVALEPEDVATVREALKGRNVKIGGDEVGFDRVPMPG
jgi:hypothetical protein